VSEGIGLAEALLGLDGFRVLAVHETTAELEIRVETTATVAWCAACGTRAELHERKQVELRDLACFGRPARLVWAKRRWRCQLVARVPSEHAVEDLRGDVAVVAEPVGVDAGECLHCVAEMTGDGRHGRVLGEERRCAEVA
jgi:hypothetical protein